MGKRDEGRLAVTAKYGPEMWERIESWPIAAKNFGLIYGYDQQSIADDVERAEGAVRKARWNKRFALDQAEIINDNGTEDFAQVDVQAALNTLHRKRQEALATMHKYRDEGPA